MAAKRVVVLDLNEADYDAVQKAMGILQAGMSENSPGGPELCEGDSNLQGMLVSQICRGYLDMLDLPLEWPQ